MGILKFALILLLPLFISGNLLRIQVQENVFINPLDAALILLMPQSIFYLMQYTHKLHAHPLAKYVGVFLATLAISLLVGSLYLKPQDILVAFGYLLRFIAYTQLIFIPYLLGKKFAKRYLALLFAAIAATSILGLIQYTLYKDLRNLLYLGWDEHLHRLFSTFLDPNFAGVLFALGIALGAYLVQVSKKRAQKGVAILLSTLAFSLLLSYSRTAYISFTTAVVIFITKYIGKKYIIGVVLILGLSYLLLPKDLFGEGVKLTRTASIFARVEEFQQGIEVFSTHPLTGVGFNAYGAQTPSENVYPDNARGGLPNSYIFLLATSGIVGAGGIIYVMYGIYRLYTHAKKKVYRQLLLSTSVILLTSALFENTLFYNFNMFVYFTILGSISVLYGE